jgi:hypothetical protein
MRCEQIHMNVTMQFLSQGRGYGVGAGKSFEAVPGCGVIENVKIKNMKF